MKIHIHVEVLLQDRSSIPEVELTNLIIEELKASGTLIPASTITNFHNSELRHYIQNINLSEVLSSYFDNTKKHCDLTFIKFEDADPLIHFYRLNTDEMEAELITMEDGTEVTCAANHCLLPNSEFYSLWESLVYDSPVKYQLLKYAETTMLFSKKGVNSTIINWNKVILLHGPPGSGKTSLCKALAQKLSTRLNHLYKHAEFMEINSHSLFSKYFSESGKLVTEMFNKIKEQLDFKESFVCVLIDEVESLARARDAVLAGTEPSDAIRVVNALLTQIDVIKRYPNVLILTTSNLSRSIDLAFVDRADLKIYIGPPEEPAIYKIYSSCLEELIRVKVIEGKIESKLWCSYKEIKNHQESNCLPLEESELHPNSLKVCNKTGENSLEDNEELLKSSKCLLEVSKSSVGLSGRTLRKIPFITHVKFIGSCSVSLNQFLIAMQKTVEECSAEIDWFHRN